MTNLHPAGEARPADGAVPDLRDTISATAGKARLEPSSAPAQTGGQIGPVPIPSGLRLDVHDGPNPWTNLDLPKSGEHFSFVLISDRTGGARPGVFERGLATTDLLAPSFAIQLGDMIEGYSDDLAEIDEQWSEIDGMFSGMQTSVFHTPGNHDVSTPMMEKMWQQRYGRLYFHFRYNDALFLVLDTQDTPDVITPEMLAGVADFEKMGRLHPREMRIAVANMLDWDGTQPAKMGEEQLTYFEDVLRTNQDVRWTFINMHMPLWQGNHPAWTRLKAALGGRNYHAFAGHVHNYKHEHIDGNSHVRLGPTGGLWVLGGPEGNFDHVTQVTVTDRGPVVANILLDGIRDIDGQPILPLATRSVPIF